MKRVALVILTRELFAQLLGCLPRSDVRVQLDGLPEDTVLLGFHVDPERDLIALKLTSNTFRPVPAGEAMPWLTVSWTVHDVPKPVVLRDPFCN